MSPRWLSPAAAAAHLGVSRSTLRGLVAAGQLPPPSYRLGRRLPRYDRESLDRLLAGRAAGEAVDEIAAEISRGLASAEVFGGRAYLRTPMLLPSGASVVVVIEQEGAGRFRITDLGQGHDEAETLGFGRIYRRQAEDVAGLQGLTADQGALSLRDLGPEELTGATMALASAVLRTMERAMLRAADRRRAPQTRRASRQPAGNNS